MKVEKLLHRDIVTGAILGAVVGLYFPSVLITLEPFKMILGLVALYLGLKVVGTIK